MTDIQIYNQISSLPSDLKKQVADFIASLKKKAGSNTTLKKRQFGGAKGLFKMSKDFDEPLDDFKAYM